MGNVRRDIQCRVEFNRLEVKYSIHCSHVGVGAVEYICLLSKHGSWTRRRDTLKA